ncbi:hypothetical protein RFM41_30415 [Mesorhizobium sp. VK25A]|nr:MULTISPECIES: hypothetical protein [unclassified Mesorhizobium]MDX8535246.1 hypothetical protein [Mesorhizobium sp. VK25D]MDX8548083.1 hypothetical protein [Mesorhizobium sp. VK25A]
MTDPAVEDGVLITLPPPKVSQTKTGLAAAIRSAELPSAGGADDLAAFMRITGER